MANVNTAICAFTECKAVFTRPTWRPKPKYCSHLCAIKAPRSLEHRKAISKAHKGKKKPWVKGNGGATKGRAATERQREGLKIRWRGPRGPLSPEHAAKFKAGRLAYVESEEHRKERGKLIAASMAAKTPEAKKAWHKKSGQARRGPRPNKRGPACNLWRGGIAQKNRTERQKAMQSWEYRDWRRSVFERDNFTCQKCGKRGGYLHADHIKPWASHPTLRYDVHNGRTLCVPCHHKTPTWGNGGKKRKDG